MAKKKIITDEQTILRNDEEGKRMQKQIKNKVCSDPRPRH